MNAPTCPCGLCGKSTRMLGTKRCDACWELERRIEMDPELSARILASGRKGPFLFLDGRVYTLVDGRVLIDGVYNDPVEQRPALMARLALVKVALETAETSLL